MNPRARWLAVLPVLFLALFLPLLTMCHQREKPPACQGALGCVHIAPGEAIRLGVLQALSGPNAENGRSMVRAIEMAVEDAGGGILGHPISLQIEDAGCAAEIGAAAAMKIAIDAGAIGVIGTFCSGSAATAAEVITNAGMSMISGSNSAPSLTSVENRRGANWHAGYFRVMFNGTGMARTAAHFAHAKLALKRAATVDDGSLYTREYTREFARTFQQLGGGPVTAISINRGDENMDPAIIAMALAEAQCVYFPIYQREAELLARRIHNIRGTEGMIFIGGGALLTESFLKSVGPLARGMYFSTVVTPEGPACDRLRQRYEQRHGEPPQHFSHAHNYDAARLLLRAIESVAVRGADGGLVVDRQALRDALYATRNFPGVTGPLTCDEFGDCSADAFKIVRLDDPSAGLDGLKSNIVYTHAPGAPE